MLTETPRPRNGNGRSHTNGNTPDILRECVKTECPKRQNIKTKDPKLMILETLNERSCVDLLEYKNPHEISRPRELNRNFAKEWLNRKIPSNRPNEETTNISKRRLSTEQMSHDIAWKEDHSPNTPNDSQRSSQIPSKRSQRRGSKRKPSSGRPQAKTPNDFPRNALHQNKNGTSYTECHRPKKRKAPQT